MAVLAPTDLTGNQSAAVKYLLTLLWLVFLPTFTCLMLHKSHLNIFVIQLRWPDFQQLKRGADADREWTIAATNQSRQEMYSPPPLVRFAKLKHNRERESFFGWSGALWSVLTSGGRDDRSRLRWTRWRLLLTHLHGDVCGRGGVTLELLVTAAARAPHQLHAGRAVDVLHLRGVLLHHLHQLLDGPAEAAAIHFSKHQHYGTENLLLVSESWSQC